MYLTLKPCNACKTCYSLGRTSVYWYTEQQSDVLPDVKAELAVFMNCHKIESLDLNFEEAVFPWSYIHPSISPNVTQGNLIRKAIYWPYPKGISSGKSALHVVFLCSC